MNLPLFSAFTPTDKTAWKAQVIKDLKGKDFETTLLWQTDEGITMQPYYTSEDLTDTRLGDVQSHQKSTLGWLTQSVILFENESITNTVMRQVLQKGADAIHLDLRNTDIQKVDFPKLFHGIKLSNTPVYFQTPAQEISVITALQLCMPYQLKGGFSHDGLAQWMQAGQWTHNYFADLALAIDKTQDSPQFRAVCVGSHAFHNAGANAVQELAFTLAAAVAYIDKLTDVGLPSAAIFSKLYFSLSVGTNYFMEIAKLRALRYLWKLICSQWKISDDCFVHAQTSTFFDATLSPHTNMIRATTEAMSAVMGGCDMLTIHGYDATFQEKNEFSERIARNISIILKEEAHLDKVADPAAGSYYVENLTLELIDAAWTLFLEVEKKGGLMPAFEQNFIQDDIEENYQKQWTALQQSDKIMVGVNKYRQEDKKGILIDSTAKTSNNTSFKILPNKRIAQGFE